ncbi:MAG: DMT family transporter [Pseudomonadota bacterium]
MELWIVITIAAAAAQTVRFMVQKHLRATALSTAGATWARFLYSAPLIALGVWTYSSVTGQAAPARGPGFWGYAVMGGLAQILATMCVVALFGQRNFAVGITFKKTEVMLTALVGFVVLGDRITLAGGAAMALGFVAVLWLSDPPEAAGKGLARFLNRSAGLGVLSGLFFALSGVGYRGAVLALEGGDTALRAGAALAVVTAGQTLGLGLWLLLREHGQVSAVLNAWRVAALVGCFSMIGSFCWFAAFSLQNAAYVFAVGQIEIAFSILAAVLFFQETISRREGVGMALLAASILMLVLLG